MKVNGTSLNGWHRRNKMTKVHKIRKSLYNDERQLRKEGYSQDVIESLPTIFEITIRHPRKVCDICDGSGEMYHTEDIWGDCIHCDGVGMNTAWNPIKIGNSYDELLEKIEEVHMLNKLANVRTPYYIIEGEEE